MSYKLTAQNAMGGLVRVPPPAEAAGPAAYTDGIIHGAIDMIYAGAGTYEQPVISGNIASANYSDPTMTVLFNVSVDPSYVVATAPDDAGLVTSKNSNGFTFDTLANGMDLHFVVVGNKSLPIG